MPPWNVSIVLEWENARHTDPERIQMALGRLADEARANERQLAGPVEVLVCIDGTTDDSVAVRGFLAGALEGAAGVVTPRVIAVPGAEYYELKNAGAAEATGDVVVFLDSDVIPEHGWLANMLRPFEDASVAGVAGNSYIETTSLYSKAFALTWNFPLRASTDELRPTSRFASNNVAFRREIAQRFPFPTITDTARGSCSWLGVILAEKGETVVEAPSAQVIHPAPDLFGVGIARGRDRVMLSAPGRSRTLRGTAGRFKGDIGHAVRGIRNGRTRVGLPTAHVPAAFAIATSYALCLAVGEVATMVAPRFMIRHFRV